MNSEAESDYVDFVTHHANGMWRTAYLLCGDRRRSSTEVVCGDSYFDGEADPTDHVGRANAA